MTTVHDIPKLDGTGRRLGHTPVTVTQDLAGVVTLTADDRRYEFPIGLWFKLTAPSAEVLRLIRDLAGSPVGLADDPFANLNALIMRARKLRGAPLWWTSRDPDGPVRSSR
jgi:hypothetical protein